jgi:hypothetical protein
MIDESKSDRSGNVEWKSEKLLKTLEKDFVIFVDTGDHRRYSFLCVCVWVVCVGCVGGESVGSVLNEVIIQFGPEVILDLFIRMIMATGGE